MITRYTMEYVPPDNEDMPYSETEYGGWVRYEDHESIVKELEERCERLNRECQKYACEKLGISPP